MKTNTTVPVADYLELYEFKKAYDEGKTVFKLVHEYDRITECCVTPKDLTEELKSLIHEYGRIETQEYFEEVINELNKEIFKKEKNLDIVILDKVSVEKELTRAQKAVVFLTIALIASLIAISILV